MSNAAQFSKSDRSGAKSATWRVILALLLAATLPVSASAHPIVIPVAFKVFATFGGAAKLTDYLANKAYAKAPRPGTCDERRERLVHVLPELLRLARLSRDIYGQGTGLKAAGLETKELGNGVQAVYEAAGQHYAEIHTDAARNQVLVVFQGTRMTVRGDVASDVAHLVGIDTAYYKWASAIVERVVREHPGSQVVVTGHSLGGGLALFAVLRNPGVEAVVFNPAGLSRLTWLLTSRAERARINAATTVVATRNPGHVDPLTAISLSHQSVVPGTLMFVESDATTPLALHSATRMVTGIERLAATQGEGTACEGVLGVLAH